MDDPKTIRQTLHRHPELSGAEHQTSKRVRQWLEATDPDEIVSLAGTGLMAVYDSGTSGPTILLRAELDALPIEEQGKPRHRSETEGVAHLCGHDGHMAMLLGVAQHLKSHRPKKGRVLLLFQPAEETGQGARAILEDPKWPGYEPGLVFAIHNVPGKPLGEVLVREGVFTPAVRSAAITLAGKEAHAAEPEQGSSPAPAIAALLMKAEEWTNNYPNEPGFRLMVPIHIRMGEKAYGTAAGKAELHFTMRAWEQAAVDSLAKELEHQVRLLGQQLNLETGLEWVEPFEATDSHPKAVALVKQAASHAGLDHTEPERPFRWGEDFGLIMQEYPGALIGLGAGEKQPPLHHPTYDFPDALLEKGTALWIALLQKAEIL